MRMSKSSSATNKTVVAVLTADPAFEQSVRATFGASGAIELRVVSGTIASVDAFDTAASRSSSSISTPAARRRWGAGAHDAPHRRLAAGGRGDAELRRRSGAQPVADAGRGLPGQAGAAGGTGAHLRARRAVHGGRETTEAQIYTFTPAVGGAGVTTLAIQTALLLLKAAARAARTCLVDLDFQHGACADYLDLEPRLDLKEIEPRPERLDRQLLEIMLSHHASGLKVIAAPNRPAEMRTSIPTW